MCVGAGLRGGVFDGVEQVAPVEFGFLAAVGDGAVFVDQSCGGAIGEGQEFCCGQCDVHRFNHGIAVGGGVAPGGDLEYAFLPAHFAHAGAAGADARGGDVRCDGQGDDWACAGGSRIIHGD